MAGHRINAVRDRAVVALPARLGVASDAEQVRFFIGMADRRWAIAAFAPVTSAATQDVDPSKQYRTIGARHVYVTYQPRIFKGKLPPLLYAITITETEIDENGNVISAVVTREPAPAKEVRPWAVSMIHAASPFPKPGSAGRTRYTDIWLVDKSYTFHWIC